MFDNFHKNPKSEGMYSQTTRSVRISVVPEHLAENSDPENDVYAFSYTITIENLGEGTVQLLERHWIILSGGGSNRRGGRARSRWRSAGSGAGTNF